MTTFTSFKRYLAGGVANAGVGFYDIDGYYCGGALSLAAGESADMLRWWGMKQITPTTPQRTRVTQTGDDVPQGFLSFEATDVVTLAIQTGLNDLTLGSVVGGASEYDDGFMTMQPFAPLVDELPSAVIIANCKAKKKVYGESSKKGWEVWMMASAEISAGAPDGITERALRNYNFSAACAPVEELPWGDDLTDNFGGILGGAGIITTLPYWVSMAGYRGHASNLDVVLNYVPVSSAHIQIRSKDIAAGTWADLALTTDYTLSGKTITFEASQAGKHNVIRYMHQGVVNAS